VHPRLRKRRRTKNMEETDKMVNRRDGEDAGWQERLLFSHKTEQETQALDRREGERGG
jgi:hypothetical protein